MRNSDKDIPAIEIILEKDNRKYALEIMNGIEEEGIPYRITEVLEGTINSENVLDYAFMEAQKSKLQMGIALCPEKTVFHFSRLKKEHPVFTIEEIFSVRKEELRLYGNNIARLVKGIPLKENKSKTAEEVG